MMRERSFQRLLAATVIAAVIGVAWLAFQLAGTPAPPPPVVAPAAKAPSQPAPAPTQGSSSSASAASEPAAPTPDLSLRSAADELHDSLKKALQRSDVVHGEVLLTFKDAQALAAFNTRAAFYGLRPVSSDARLLTARVKFSDLDRLVQDIREHPGDYEGVGLNHLLRIPGLPPEPQKDSANAGGQTPFEQTTLAAIGAIGDRTKWGKGITVAIIDSGIGDHQTFRDNQVRHIDLNASEPGVDGHGTAMASLIAGSETPVDGVAPGATLLDIRVTNAKGVSNTALVAEGIMRVIDEGAQVINISLGGAQDAAMLRNAVEYALKHNVVVVAAAGNEQVNRISFPAGIKGVVSVGAVDAKGVQAYFSNSGENLVISAPGVGVISAYPNNQMVIGSGTSQATALTSGVIAALLSRGYKPEQMIETLTRNARQAQGTTSQVGAGILHIR